MRIDEGGRGRGFLVVVPAAATAAATAASSIVVSGLRALGEAPRERRGAGEVQDSAGRGEMEQV
jgi:hypothetical protein